LVCINQLRPIFYMKLKEDEHLIKEAHRRKKYVLHITCNFINNYNIYLKRFSTFNETQSKLVSDFMQCDVL
jgi:uncharacterized membrane protein